MGIKICDTIIVSDLDGTIVPASGVISEVNKQAIKRFEDLGGTFTIATGRTPLHAMKFAAELYVKTPFIAGNGSAIFDPQTQTALWNKCYDKESAECFKKLITELPHIGAVLIDTDDRYHIINDSEGLQKYVRSGYIHDVTYEDKEDFFDCFPDNLRSGWLSLDKDEFVEACLWLAHNRTEIVNFAVSGECFIDILPGGVSKGASFEKLICGIYEKELANAVAIGDFPNDIEMIKEAGLGVAVANAHEDVKKAASLIVKSCEEDGVADLIAYLIETREH